MNDTVIYKYDLQIADVRGTGHVMGSATGKKYLGTFQIDEGTFVFHVFYTP